MPEYLARRSMRSLSRHVSRGGRRPFAGADGEGSTINGRHQYLLLRAGDQLLINDDGSPLSAFQCLQFIADLPQTHTYVSYFFDYDVTMILRDLPPERIARLLDIDCRRVPGKPCSSFPIDWGKFQIDYMPRKELRVRQCTGSVDGKKSWSQWSIISDTGSFFQASFVKTLDRWFLNDTFTSETKETVRNEYTGIIELIAEGKKQRHDFQQMDEYEIAYNRAECEMLAILMEKFRTMCDALNIRPNRWQGPGNLVSSVMKREGVPLNKDLTIFDEQPELVRMANDGYYGGRFECKTFGRITGPIHQYDINSAYANTYRDLPCLVHGKWHPIQSRPRDNSIYVGRVTFKHKQGKAFGTLPVRHHKTGVLLFPMAGSGTYWSPELSVASEHTSLTFHDGYKYERLCDCQTFKWVYDVYDERLKLKAAGDGAEKVLKILLASTYGKLAQSIGCAPYSNSIWASLIVSNVRATLARGTLLNGNANDVIMLATDGIFCREERALPVGTELGQWEHTIHDEMFVVQSGIYFLPGLTPKTRGIKTTSLATHRNEFESLWADWIRSPEMPIPSVGVPLTQFIGLRLAHARNKPELAGQWIDTGNTVGVTPKRVTFDWTSKRTFDRIINETVETHPIMGSSDLVSAPYRRQIGGIQVEERLGMQDQPEWGPQII